ncbi:neuropeptide FF receptor 2-like [Tachypleus tridentatus]|uniref:neuropeptide FF receptor 2-like n=1 Tax=Tachypleus tridentatus TaxID=6853 RepID=UPI003FD0C854
MDNTNLSSWNSDIVWEELDNVSGWEYENERPYLDFTQIPAICVTFIVLYFIVMVLALSGNAMVCYTVFCNRKMHTVVNYYIVNLAVCDFMVGAFVLPVKLLELTAPADWRMLNNGLCTALPYLQTIFVFTSVLTLVATCLERYFAVVHPLESRMQQSKARAKRILLIIWGSPCFVSLPFLYPSEATSNTLPSNYGTITRLTCLDRFSDSFRRAYYTLLFCFIYLLPLSFIAGTCFQIAKCILEGISLHRLGSLRRQEENRRKVAKMVIVVVLAFVLCWTPYFLVTIITQYQKVNFLHQQNFFFTMLCINLCAFLNSCVNPFIYALMSTRFRNGFKQILRILFCYSSTPSSPISKKTTRRTPTGRGLSFGYNHQMVLLYNEMTHNSSESVLQSGVTQLSLPTGSFCKSRKIVRKIPEKSKVMKAVDGHRNDVVVALPGDLKKFDHQCSDVRPTQQILTTAFLYPLVKDKYKVTKRSHSEAELDRLFPKVSEDGYDSLSRSDGCYKREYVGFLSSTNTQDKITKCVEKHDEDESPSRAKDFAICILNTQETISSERTSPVYKLDKIFKSSDVVQSGERVIKSCTTIPDVFYRDKQTDQPVTFLKFKRHSVPPKFVNFVFPTQEMTQGFKQTDSVLSGIS